MRTNLIVIDNFYNNAESTREFILTQNFEVVGNYPGKRTQSYATDYLKEELEKIIGKKITHWPSNYNGSFQYTTADQDSWIHRDTTEWAGIVYLTPDAPPSAGTAFFRHKELGLEEMPKSEAAIPQRLRDEGKTLKEIQGIMDNDSNNMDKWDQVDNVGNKFNRLILFRGTRSHRSMTYFGKDKHDGRLFQIFFFNT